LNPQPGGDVAIRSRTTLLSFLRLMTTVTNRLIVGECDWTLQEKRIYC